MWQILTRADYLNTSEIVFFLSQVHTASLATPQSYDDLQVSRSYFPTLFSVPLSFRPSLSPQQDTESTKSLTSYS